VKNVNEKWFRKNVANPNSWEEGEEGEE